MHFVAVLEASWGVMGACWVQNGGQHGSNLAPKTEPKSEKMKQKTIKILMALGIVFFCFRDFGGIEEVKWSQVGIKIGSKSNVNVDKRFFENRALAAAGARFFKFKGSKLAAKIYQKTIRK